MNESWPGAASSPPAPRIHGVVIGVVTNNEDPDGLGRVKLRFPWLSDEHESWWARVAAPMAGPEAGVYFLPEVDDEVLAAFEQGDVNYPYVIGALWGKAKPPADNGDGKNAIRMIRSRKGLTITLDDTDDAEQIVVTDGEEAATITLDAANRTVKVEAAQDVTITAKDGVVTIEAPDVTVKAGSTLELKGAEVSVVSEGALTLKGGSSVVLKGPKVEVSADGMVQIKGSVINVG